MRKEKIQPTFYFWHGIKPLNDDTKGFRLCIKLGLGKRLGSKSFNLMLRRRKRDSRGLKYVNGSCFHHFHMFKTTVYIEKKRTVNPLGHFAG